MKNFNANPPKHIGMFQHPELSHNNTDHDVIDNFSRYPGRIGNNNMLETPEFTQPLNSSQINKLMNSNSEKNTTKIDETSALCTHKLNNEFMLRTEGEYQICSICGAKFELIDYKEEEIIKLSNNINTLIQNIKTIYLNAPEEDLEECKNIIISMDNLLCLYNKANNNFKKYDSSNVINISK